MSALLELFHVEPDLIFLICSDIIHKKIWTKKQFYSLYSKRGVALISAYSYAFRELFFFARRQNKRIMP
jgi:hypothetical protein